MPGIWQSLRLSYAIFVLCVLGRIIGCHASDQERKIYIVYMGHLGENVESSSMYHSSMLQDVVDSRFQGQPLIRSYTRSFNGFAAYLTHEEQEKLSSKEEVVSVFPSKALQPQTTRSWDFMGLRENAHRNPPVEGDTIVGVIDTGIWPESESFSDKGFGPPPKKWRGVCKGGQNFTCNNKLIGARYYNSVSPSENDSARDIQGHGSHTASIAAGNAVTNTSFFGIANGIARGGVPSARIAAYKVCLPFGCQSADILAAFDDAIADGVDIISISIGITNPAILTNDEIAIGSFHASEKGILVVHSAGNSGPGAVASTAPWIFTVAASTSDRGIVTKVVLGNGTTITGKAVNPFDLKGKSFPLAYGQEVSSSCNDQSARACVGGCLDKRRVNGKVVLCSRNEGMEEALNAGAVGSVVPSTEALDVSFVVPFPASVLSAPLFNDLQGYFNSTKNHTVDILKSELVRNLNAPSVASFSSRGPNVIFPKILKPDVTAPGIEILAAFSPLSSPSEFPQDKQSVNYNVLSGTSMACPHVTGAAAYVKSFHPNWSPSAIKSALMTTAWRMNATKDPKAEFSYGTGHIDPVKAADPGLVYEILTDDYIEFLCDSGYDAAFLSKLSGTSVHCPGNKPISNDLNYPSMTYKVTLGDENNAAFSAHFNRTVTNVGSTNSIYKAITSSSLDYNITVNPSILKFSALGQKQSFEVTISGTMSSNTKLMTASLEWSDGVHSARSPIVVYSDQL
ncbi:Subtilase 4.13 isoform 2 [Dorcoceras hygrometricum]|uniref:Subtilase 4.13 isoform 2 n=1 Tax=Dorcoceras hygrometricum TaxID=472368 RepID=A0A2Z7CGI1_9LAMI|nr:Subtilase 4.13 isoform 2 [Dorcoceras hygrometricum]